MTSPEIALARLRAAAALLPAIEADLTLGKLSPERAALMGEFCQWATESSNEACEESLRLAKLIGEGLSRLKAHLG